MRRYRTVAEIEADLRALRAAADRAGMALACVFSSSDEFEASIIDARREAGVYRPRRSSIATIRTMVLIALLAFVFLMV
jgi:hypothetical protein